MEKATVPLDTNSSQSDDNPPQIHRQSQEFGATWDPTDSAHLLPALRLKHIPRAWERKAQSPAIKHRIARKVWHRHDFPQSHVVTASSSTSVTDRPKFLNNARMTRIKNLIAASPSPKKVVKKRCVNTGFGQSATANHWDMVAATPLRKRAHKHVVHAQSPLRYSKKSAMVPEIHASAPDEPLVEVQADDSEKSDKGDWSDVASEEDQVEEEPETQSNGGVTPQQSVDVNVSDDAMPETQEDSPSPQDDQLIIDIPEVSETCESVVSPVVDLQNLPSSPTLLDVSIHSPIHRSVSAPPAGAESAEARQKPRISDDTAILHAFLNRAAASKKPSISIGRRESLTNRRDSDVVRQALASPAKVDILGDLDPNSPMPRKSVAVVEDVACENESESSLEPSEETPETLPEPAVENEAAATDAKPTRRSIRSRNRVVQLGPLAASPSKYAKGPNKITIRSTGTPVAIKRTDAQELSLLTRANTRKNKGGSIMPVVRLCELATEPASREPSEESSGAPAEKVGDGAADNVKGVRWDVNLAYYQEFEDDADSQEARRSVPCQATMEEEAEREAEKAAAAAAAAQAPTPVKSKVRRPRTPSKASQNAAALSVGSEVEADEIEPQSATTATEETTSKAAAAPASLPKKRKSRIATPAKGLLSSAASLLPAEVAASRTGTTTSDAAPASTAPAASTASTTATGSRTRKHSTRSLPTPKKLNFEALGPSSSSSSSSTKTTKTTAKSTSAKPAAGSIATTTPPTSRLGLHPAPKLPAANPSSNTENKLTKKPSSAAPSLSTISVSAATTTTTTVTPGLASPAKKRPKTIVGTSLLPRTASAAGHHSNNTKSSTAGSADDADERDSKTIALSMPPGLASPAKRRVRPRVL
ncbi:hypothetical protein AAFC00_004862 [Neodothiora populina]|uniref:Uncharacterized protein n=1 Tax=Neodothiora populina TaxID=2781224 RepID=A0ABR3P3R0_9PEZI